jgi:hypothetical protein
MLGVNDNGESEDANTGDGDCLRGTKWSGVADLCHDKCVSWSSADVRAFHTGRWASVVSYRGWAGW